LVKRSRNPSSLTFVASCVAVVVGICAERSQPEEAADALGDGDKDEEENIACRRHRTAVDGREGRRPGDFLG